MLSRILHPILGLSGWEAYLLVGVLCFGEAAVLLGFVLPGETAVVLGGVLAQQRHVSLPVMMLVVVCCAIAGDSVGYEVGRHFGPAILKLRPMRRPAVGAAQRFIKRRGTSAVFLGRFTAIFRAIVPGIAGMSELSYPRFLAANALGGIIWGVGFTLGGYALGGAYEKVLKGASTVSYVIIGLAVAAVVVWQVRRRVLEHRATSAFRAGGDGAAASGETPTAPDEAPGDSGANPSGPDPDGGRGGREPSEELPGSNVGGAKS